MSQWHCYRRIDGRRARRTGFKRLLLDTGRLPAACSGIESVVELVVYRYVDIPVHCGESVVNGCLPICGNWGGFGESMSGACAEGASFLLSFATVSRKFAISAVMARISPNRWTKSTFLVSSGGRDDRFHTANAGNPAGCFDYYIMCLESGHSIKSWTSHPCRQVIFDSRHCPRRRFCEYLTISQS